MLLLPTVLLLVLLIYLFPYTGLGRIISIPSTIIINSLIILLCLVITNKVLWIKISKILMTIVITIWITIAGYPQEFNQSVLVQSKNAIHAIQAIDNITKEDLNVDGNVNNPRYVVALYKYRNEILNDGTYQLYQRDNVYFYNYSINDVNEISSKLIGHHKVMWWYLNALSEPAASTLSLLGS
ncbi:hypothetical protein [Paenibacillus monticola]|uniref:hypothetical protein n=1 Tax=Paenibacillus monticola TaxID=2666075 RepID=UPI001E4A8B56|nr:hypothetical protein [Paenibacillus monticola]